MNTLKDVTYVVAGEYRRLKSLREAHDGAFRRLLGGADRKLRTAIDRGRALLGALNDLSAAVDRGLEELEAAPEFPKYARTATEWILWAPDPLCSIGCSAGGDHEISRHPTFKAAVLAGLEVESLPAGFVEICISCVSGDNPPSSVGGMPIVGWRFGGVADKPAPSHTLIVLGAQDAEMDAIEALALAAGLPVAYATNGHPAERGADRVTPATAYAVTSLSWSDAGRAPVPPGAWYPRRIVAIECGFPKPGEACSPAELEFWGHGGSEDPEVVTIDHHQPGDPGFGRPPSEFLAASSIGQFVSWLARVGKLSWRRPARDIERMLPGAASRLGEWRHEPGGDGGPLDPGPGWFIAYDADSSDHAMFCRVPLYVVLTAAADHCLAAAYARQCPGVDPAALLRHRAETVLTRTDGFGRPGSRTAAEVELSIDVSTEDLAASALIDLGGVKLYDLRGRRLRDLPEVACILGVGYLADAPGRPGEPPKVVLGGCGEGTVPGVAPVEAFRGGWAEAQGLVRPYGDPVRGFAGAYLPQPQPAGCKEGDS